VFIRCRSIGRVVAIVATALALGGTVDIRPAPAQTIFEALFGFDHRRGPLPPRVSAYADPFGHRYERPVRRITVSPNSEYRGSGPSSGFCVRSCDGLYFPVRSNGSLSAIEMCRSSCPGAQTQVFSGSRSVDHSVGPKGQRYSNLETAFLYRTRKVDGCTCNGRHTFGLVPLKLDNDPTLRPGDIVATNDGLMTFNGNRRDKTAEFTPIEKSGGPSEWRLRLMSIKVTPAPEQETTAAIAAPVEEKQPERRRAQRATVYR
jgi:hypothetical protein